MRSGIFSLAAGLGALAAGSASADIQSCARGGDVRTIEVIAPGEIGAACDVRYVREDGANISVPYHADFNAEYCAEKAQEIIASLESAGYECVIEPPVVAPPPLRAEAEEGDAPATAALAGNGLKVGDLVPEAPREPEAPPMLEQPEDAAPARLAEADLEGGPAGPAAAAFAIPAPAAADRGPTALAPANASLELSKPGPSAYGRVVGAAPEDAPPASAVTAKSEPAAAPAPVSEAAPQTGPVAAAPARGAEDVIKAVLKAQAAAWNDGDLDAFMKVYWNSPDLRFVSGAAVTAGWAQTLKRYRERYGTGEAMGRLSFDGLDVKMVSDDVAVVVGRYGLARPGGDSSGAFTLVMKRFGGLWRIVHDHTSPDTQSTE